MGPSRFILACLGALALCMAATGSALAATAPPGNSEVNQYAETLPGGGGQNTVNPPGSGPAGGGGGGGNGGGQSGGAPVIPPQTQRQLNRLGPDGRAAAAIAEANAPQLPPGVRAQGAGGGNAGGGQGAGKGDNVVGAVTGALTGSDQGGMGAFLPIALFGIAGLGIGYALARRRARQLG